MDAGAPLQFDAIPVRTPPGGPLAVELVPAPDPWEVARRFANRENLLFLDSAEKHGERGRYSYVAASWTGIHSGRLPPKRGSGFRQWVDFIGRCVPAPTLPDLPPFQGGFGGLFGYDLAHEFERIPQPHRDEFQCPIVALNCYAWVISF